MANYRSSQSFHTLTHWQSGAGGHGKVNVNNIRVDALLLPDGQIALVPMEIAIPGYAYNALELGYYSPYTLEGNFSPSVSALLGGEIAAYMDVTENVTCEIHPVDWDNATGQIYLPLYDYFSSKHGTVHITKEYTGYAVQPVIDQIRIICGYQLKEYPEWLGAPGGSVSIAEMESGENPHDLPTLPFSMLNTALANWEPLINALEKPLKIESGSPMYRGENLVLGGSYGVVGGRLYDSKRGLRSALGRSTANWPGGIVTGYFYNDTNRYLQIGGSLINVKKGNAFYQNRKGSHYRSGWEIAGTAATVAPSCYKANGKWQDHDLRFYMGGDIPLTTSFTSINTENTLYFYNLIRIRELKVVENFSFFN